jgi:hypothetical protein
MEAVFEPFLLLKSLALKLLRYTRTGGFLTRQNATELGLLRRRMRTAIMHGDMNGDQTKHRSYSACDENAVPELQDMHETGPLLGSKVGLKRFKETK